MSKAQKKTETPPKTRQKAKWIFFSLLGVFLLFGGAVVAYAFYYTPRFLPHSEIAGVDIGGMTKADALTAVTNKSKNFLSTPLTFTYGPKSWNLKPSDLGTSADVQTAVNALWDTEKPDAWQQQITALLKAPFLTHTQAVSVTAYSDTGLQTLTRKVLTQIETPYKETTLNFVPGNVTVVPGVSGQKTNLADVQSQINTDFEIGGTQVSLTLQPFSPQVSTANAQAALTQAQTILSAPFTVHFTDQNVQTVSPSQLASWLITTPAPNGQSLVLGLQTDAVKTQIATWAKNIDQPAQNVVLANANGVVSVATPDKTGVQVDQDATLTAIQTFVTSGTAGEVVNATVGTSQAAVRADNYQSLGLANLIGTDTTDFKGSASTRVANIQQGQKMLNNILIAPGATFSTIKNLGPIDGAHGFVPQLVILNGTQLVNEDGGGLCQVSTTLFRATLNAGLNIVERQNHSFRVHYYEVGTGPGLDATIYDPQPDFQWKNDTASNIYLESSIKGTTITFDLYGTSDGRVSTIGTPQILSTSTPGPAEYINTPSLPTGKTVELIGPVDGAKVTVTYSVMRNGQQLENRTFVSNYIAEPAQIEVGTGPAN